jgi:hypothetical protein
MPEALSSFLVSVSLILVVALFVPCIESLAKFLRRGAKRRNHATQGEPVWSYSREIA